MGADFRREYGLERLDPLLIELRTQLKIALFRSAEVPPLYVYDARGRRVSKTSAAGTFDYLYDTSGQQIGDVGSAGWPEARCMRTDAT